MKINTIILAAGQGTRMRSAKPKVLHQIAGKPLLQHVYETSCQLPENEICIVYGHGGDQVLSELDHLQVHWIEQRDQLGTGHAVQQANGYINDNDKVLILYGDVPLLKIETIKALLAKVTDHALALLTVVLDEPQGYGRIVRNSKGQVSQIVEEKDADQSVKMLKEVNTGIMAVMGGQLINWLSQLNNNNAQAEYYLTDVIEMAANDGMEIATVSASSTDEVLGVNNREQLSHLERVYQVEQCRQLMAKGVSLIDPNRFDLRGKIEFLGRDIEIDINVIFEGRISLGNNVKIGANCILHNAVIGDNVEILPNSIIEDSKVGSGSRIGPFARLRPQTNLADHVHIGNFVEIKKSQVAQGSKINHLSYVGDAVVGSKVNIGAGTITCNYDGVNKYQTTIGDGAFIGSNSQLVAPVSVGNYATIGAGSTITKDAPENQLTLARSKQINVKGWKRPDKEDN